jgi:hypothetical protein
LVSIARSLDGSRRNGSDIYEESRLLRVAFSKRVKRAPWDASGDALRDSGLNWTSD